MTVQVRGQEATWDAAVVGVGPAGSVAALTLARAGIRVLLIAVPPDNERRKVGETLPGAATRVLRDLHLLPLLHNGRHLPCHGALSAWGSDGLTAVDFIRDPYGHGWRLDRYAFDADLQSAAHNAGAQPRWDRILRVERNGDRWRLDLRGGGHVEARWLLDATGRSAAISRQLGARRLRDARLIALCGWFPARDADTRTLVEADPDGWWYTALTPDGSRIVVYHVEPAMAASLLRAGDGYQERLARTTYVQATCRAAKLLAPVRATDAGGARLDRFGGPGWLAVGDAALAFDPLSSQGIFTALYSGMKAGRAVLYALSCGSPIADTGYTDQMESIRAAYLRHWIDVYRSERRWLDHPFWLHRQLSTGRADR